MTAIFGAYRRRNNQIKNAPKEAVRTQKLTAWCLSKETPQISAKKTNTPSFVDILGHINVWGSKFCPLTDHIMLLLLSKSQPEFAHNDQVMGVPT